jgi:hypothetical protein
MPRSSDTPRPLFQISGLLILGLLIVVVGLGSRPAWSADALHVAIDRLIREKHPDSPVAAVSDDAEFFRRVCLDFTGQIPTAEETRRFLADRSADKRAATIERLLSASTFPQRMTDLFHVMLIERRGEDDAWRSWLTNAFQQNMHWNELVLRILNPNADDESNRAAAWFTTKRLDKYGQNPIDYPGLVRDVGRLFLGVDLQCAECHDHLFVDDYKQVDFKGLFTVYQNTYIRRDVKFPAIGEKAMTAKLDFVSVFDPTQKATGPRIPFGREIEIPEQPGVAELFKNPKTAPPRPEWSPLDAVARELTRTDNRLFARNGANRLWFALTGRGLVWPLDAHHSDNPPSQPELLDALTDAFVASDFDIKLLLREIALSGTYQRSSRLPDGITSEALVPKPETFLVAVEKRLSAEQLLPSVLIATGERDRVMSALPDATSTDSASDSSTTSPIEAVAPDKLPTYAELKTAFSAAFANDAREPEDEFSATVKGALFWRNADPIQKLLIRRRGNLVDRLATIDDQNRMTDELYLSVLSREPREDERTLIAGYLASSEDREAALQDVVWALLTSVEFYANH